MSETTFFSSFGPLEVVAQLLQHHMRLRRVDAQFIRIFIQLS